MRIPVNNKLELALTSIVLAFTFILVYSVHLNYAYPLHLDEWHHIAAAVQVLDTGHIKSTNPYFGWNAPKGSFNLEAGFHTFLADMFLLTGLDPVLGYRLLPALFACFSSLTLFALMQRLTRHFWTSLYAMVFFASIRSSVNVLGLWFFTPLTLSIPLMYMFFLTLSRGFEENDGGFLLCAVVALSSMLLIHPVSAAFTMLVATAYLAVNHRSVMKKLPGRLVYLAATAALWLFMFSGFLWKGSVEKTLEFALRFVVFEHGWGIVEIQYNIPQAYGVVATLLALIGFIVSYQKKKWVLVIWPLMALAPMRLYPIVGYTILIPYQRLFYYLMLSLAPLSAIGLNTVLESVRSLLRARQWLASTASALVTVSVLVASFQSYYEPLGGYDLYHAIDENTYDAIKFLGLEYGQNNVVLADPLTSLAVYPVSRNHVTSTIEGPLGGGPIEDTKLFFKGNCSEKHRITRSYNVDFVLSRARINCENFVQVYEKPGVFVYSLTDIKQFTNALRSYESGDMEQAADLLRRYTSEHPEGRYAGEAWYLVGRTSQRAGRLGEALKAYWEVVESHPSSPYVHAAMFRIREIENKTGIRDVEVNFDGSILLLGYTIDDAPGYDFKITCYWMALRRLGIDYKAAVHFLYENKTIAFQRDHLIMRGHYNTTQWRPGEVIEEVDYVKAPAGKPPGNYSVRLGVYHVIVDNAVATQNEIVPLKRRYSEAEGNIVANVSIRI